MPLETLQIREQDVATLHDAAWEQALRRSEIIRPLAALDVFGHKAADTAAQKLGLSRRHVYVLIRRAQQGTGLATDLARGQSNGGKGKGRGSVAKIPVGWRGLDDSKSAVIERRPISRLHEPTADQIEYCSRACFAALL